MLNNAALLMAVKKTVKVTQIACSAHTAWYVTNTGELYGCGRGDYGQQGNGSTARVTTFTKRADNVAQVACAYTTMNDTVNYRMITTWYVTKTGELYGCGNAYYGQQGTSFDGDFMNDGVTSTL